VARNTGDLAVSIEVRLGDFISMEFQYQVRTADIPGGITAAGIGLIVMAEGPTPGRAEEVCMIATRQMFYARLPQVKGTAGGVAFILDEVMPASPAYRWTLNHTMRLHNPLELFPTFISEAGV
jgi:hypothetical protein